MDPGLGACSRSRRPPRSAPVARSSRSCSRRSPSSARIPAVGQVSQRSEGIGGKHYGCVSFSAYPGGVPDVEAAHLRAAATHDRAALLHEEAAELFEMMGCPRSREASASTRVWIVSARRLSLRARGYAMTSLRSLNGRAAKRAPVRAARCTNPLTMCWTPTPPRLSTGVTPARAARFRSRLRMPAVRRPGRTHGRGQARPLWRYSSRCPSASPLSRTRTASLNVPSISSMW